MKRLYRGIISASLISLYAAAGAHAADEDPAAIEFFEKKIRPVLVQQCYECHAADSKEAKGGLLVDTRGGIRRGGESGPAVVPGSPDDSLLLEAIRYDGLEMPPDKPLPAAVVADFEKWIRMGAPDPRKGKAAPVARQIEFDKARQFWSFQPPQKERPPQVKDQAWPRGDIDRFILARLEQEGLRPVPDAQRRSLVRRVYFDLIGLPPTPDQVNDFLADPSPTALEELVDQLLASPHFGERWGRHWLDVVRYGESTGMERNYTYPHAWRYRDWVIAALNADKPYDEFIREQLAGDLLPAEDDDERNNLRIATGLLAIGPKSLNERNREKFLLDVADDQIDVTSRAFLGLTASCARCHDHKFDPIPQSDYYALAGIFRSTDTLYGTGGNQGNRQTGRLLELAGGDPEAVRRRAEHKTKVDALTKKSALATRQLKRLQATVAKNRGKVPAGSPAAAKSKQELADARAEVQRVQRELQQLRKNAPTPPAVAMGVRDGANPADCRVRLRGEVADLGAEVSRGFLTVCTTAESPRIDPQGSGRLELAQWIASDANPLTARVVVNRIWMQLFGRGIVATENNFGATGTPPSHPELLDFLAVRFVEEGWSLKRTIRQILLSRTYQLSGTFDQRAYEIDPDNRMLWRMPQRRLEAEALRDAMLLASGQLDLTPPAGSLVTRVGDGDIGRNLSADRFQSKDTHRSVYLPIVRSLVPEMLRLFDFPEPSIINDHRDVTTVPTQALYMMNSPFVMEQARHTAQRLLAGDAASDADRVDEAYQRILSRPARDEEQDRSLAFVDAIRNELTATGAKTDQHTEDAWAAFCQAMFAGAEFRYIQ